MVSVIIPVYNVSKYLDKCVESVVNQTYKDLEIILINDGSTDESGEKCEKWQRQDKRIKYISKSNEGLGPTRNMGIKVATGEYVMFVDSDDWVDIGIVEKLLGKLIETDSEIAICDRYNVNLCNDSYTIDAQCLEEVINVEENPKVIAEVSTAQWAKLYRRNLYIKNEILQPKHYYEDAITPVMVALCKRVCYVNEPLYYYVVSRTESITNNISSLDALVEYLKTSVSLFKKYGLFEKYSSSIFQMCSRRFDWNMYRTELLLSTKFEEVKKINQEFIQSCWPECKLKNWNDRCALEDKYYIWGSYNLMIAMKMVMKMTGTKFPENHNSFSSLISAMDNENGTLNQIIATHKSSYRKNHILKELKRDFVNKNIGEFADMESIVIDFLEERFDIAMYDGKYITISDAFEEMPMFEKDTLNRISRYDMMLNGLWKKSCLKFISVIRKFFSGKKIILVKMKLAQRYGDAKIQYDYEEITRIKEINEILEGYYRFFEENCEEAAIISVEESEWYYTDKGFRHGCYPWHLNDYMYQEIRRMIKEILR